MIDPSQFYKEQLDIHHIALKGVKKQLVVSSTVRLGVFLALCLGVYLLLGNAKAIFAIILVGIAVFLFLVTRHTKLQYHRDFIKGLIAINEQELQVLQRNFHELPTGEEFEQPEHFYSQDIDLFGRGSFFQYLNRSVLESGAQELASILTVNDIKHIEHKQEAVKELANLATWRQRFSSIASLVKTEMPAQQVQQWLDNYKPFTPPWARVVALGFSVISIVLWGLYFADVLSGYAVFGWFLLGLGGTSISLKKVNKLVSDTAKVQSTFEQYYKLLEEIEGQEMQGVLLSQKRDSITSQTKVASHSLRRFSKLLDTLDQRSNMLMGVVLNGFLLHDLRVSNSIEQWISIRKTDVSVWFEAIAFFDAYNSLGNYAFNHPSHTFPIIDSTGPVLQSKQAFHPLLDPQVAVASDFKIDQAQFFIITGANMAGKSTFLRTVALQLVMANVGLPLCASEVRYNPIKLVTSMRTTDSLTDDESYFFSELKRLKYIVEAIKDDRYFIILDEILKGTNSTDKAIGSRKFVDKLVGSKSTGIIATHDLSLTEAAKDLEGVDNYYFDAQIIDDELFFDYALKKGICQNMNASFLLKKMGIVD